MNEKVLIVQKNNDDHLRDEIINELKPMATSIVYRVVGKYYRFDYEELYMEALLYLDKAINKFDENKYTSFTTYAYQVMKNRVINVMRSKYAQKRNMGEFVYLEANIGESKLKYQDILKDDDSHSTENSFMLMEAKDIIYSTLKEDSADLYLQRLQGLSYAEIANLNNLDPIKVKRKIEYSKKKLKKNKEVHNLLLK